MDLQAEKNWLIAQILELNDLGKIRLLKSVLENEPVPQRMTVEEYNARIEQALENYKKGYGIPHETVVEKITKLNSEI